MLQPKFALTANGAIDSMQQLPNAIQDLLVIKVAVERLTVYLNQPEVKMTTRCTSDRRILFENATIGWPKAVNVEVSEELSAFTLNDVDFCIPEGQFTLVCGPLGSGKTLLVSRVSDRCSPCQLRALLGEARINSGVIVAPRSSPNTTPLNGNSIRRVWTTDTWLNDSVAYAPQQSYIRHGTIRDNVCFGQPMWRARYDEVLRQASLLPDIAMMPEGELTEVGDNGINLVSRLNELADFQSGGQKARINLARCLYSRAKTVYMDDILSAVDAHTSKFIFSECFQGALLRGRTVVLVTHHIGLCLPRADFFISLKNGRVDQACPAHQVDTKDLPVIGSRTEGTPERIPLSAKLFHESAEDSPVPRHVYRAEHSAQGRVASTHYWLVFTAAGGVGYWIVLTFLSVGAATFGAFRPVWLRQWLIDLDPADLNYNLLIFALVSAGGIVLGGLRWVWLYGIGTVGFYNAGSQKIHAMLLDGICAAPLSFFETTPAGRIMNVFSQDMNRIDTVIADDFGRKLPVD